MTNDCTKTTPQHKTSSCGKVIIISAPSGTGKSTLISHLMRDTSLNLHFSVSCTNRLPRGEEQDGVAYHFISTEQFRERIAANDFLEYEEVYAGRYYGTLKEEVEKRIERGENVICDVDVKGGCRIKSYFQDRALSVFIQPPSIETLKQRLEARATDHADVIADRLERASLELSFASRFDTIVVNDRLEEAAQDLHSLVKTFVTKP